MYACIFTRISISFQVLPEYHLAFTAWHSSIGQNHQFTTFCIFTSMPLNFQEFLDSTQFLLPYPRQWHSILFIRIQKFKMYNSSCIMPLNPKFDVFHLNVGIINVWAGSDGDNLFHYCVCNNSETSFNGILPSFVSFVVVLFLFCRF